MSFGVKSYRKIYNGIIAAMNLVDPDGKKLYFADGVSDVFKQKFAATIQFMNSSGNTIGKHEFW